MARATRARAHLVQPKALAALEEMNRPTAHCVQLRFYSRAGSVKEGLWLWPLVFVSLETWLSRRPGSGG